MTTLESLMAEENWLPADDATGALNPEPWTMFRTIDPALHPVALTCSYNMHISSSPIRAIALECGFQG